MQQALDKHLQVHEVTLRILTLSRLEEKIFDHLLEFVISRTDSSMFSRVFASSLSNLSLRLIDGNWNGTSMVRIVCCVAR